MKYLGSLLAAVVAAVAAPASAASLQGSGRPGLAIKPYPRNSPLQDIVTWDEHSIFVHGQRIMLFNGEFHPYRLPVPALWLDIFQKLKAAGFSGVSFYTDWALQEGRQGDFVSSGVFDLTQFFDAASEAGLYLVARPGPYINAEVSGGGFPGWLGRYKAVERTPSYLSLTETYVKGISDIIARAQITNGGPVILLQPENEYTEGLPSTGFPDHEYFAAVEKMYRDNGIVVPFVSNDAGPDGYFAPGNGTGSVDIYGHDGYPLGFDCANPYTWPDGDLPTNYLDLHEQESPTTPYTISEFQGGSFDPWGGNGWTKCTELLNEQFERVFYKNNYAAGIAIQNLYMVYGGTNWGNLGHPGGYTSYDYGAIIAEDRSITRQKYSELKLQANFFKVSSTYLTSTPSDSKNGSYVNTQAISTALLKGNGTKTNIYIVRQAAYNSESSTPYKLEVPTSKGNLTIPQLQGTLTLIGRDSKLHVTDYNVGGVNMLYSTAEIFTWKKYGSRTVLILYGGYGETHEAAFVGQGKPTIVDGQDVNIANKAGSIVLNWNVSPQRKVVKFPSGLVVFLLDRKDAYNYWVLDLPAQSPTNNYSHPNASSVIAHAGYLLRSATVTGNNLGLIGDINATTTLEIIGGAPNNAQVTFNGESVQTTKSKYGTISGNLAFAAPKFNIPSFSSLDWKYLDSLPEVQNGYSDALWTDADLQSNNTVRNLTTPTSLYGSDYGYNTGILLSRGHFTANGQEGALNITTQGGTAYGSSVWLNNTYLGSWYGNAAQNNASSSFNLAGKTKKGARYVITVVCDNMGLDEDYVVGTDENKDPRGVINYSLAGHKQSDVTWKITGNLGGERYADRSRGPLNEGGSFAERQGYHLPGAPTGSWKTQSPFQGIGQPGIGFFAATFDLDAPAGYDIPLAFAFTNTTGSGGAANYRIQLFVNGWNYGKYVNQIGPQTSFPVPRGILNYAGTNYVALTLWAMDAQGAKLGNFQLQPTVLVQSGYPAVDLVPAMKWSKRKGAY